METEYVFIDTTEFVSASFNFESPRLLSLKEKAINDSIFILTTDVVCREVESKIELYVEEARRDVKRLIEETDNLVKGKRFRSLRHLLPNITEKLEGVDFHKLSEESKKNFRAFLKEASVETISTDAVNAKEILDLYFGKKPPFGEGKKKAEFPDAFSLIALKEWCKKEGKKVYVISNDRDAKKVAELTSFFVSTESLEAFLQIVTEYEQNQEGFNAFLNDFGEKYTQELSTAIATVANDTEVISTKFAEYVEFQDVEVLKVALSSAYVITVHGKETIDIFVTADVTYKTTAEFQDYSDAFYDKEDGTYYGGAESRKEEIEETVHTIGLLEYKILAFPPQDWDDILLERAYLDPNRIDVDLQAILYSYYR